jgi:hypothetical protein
MKKMASSVLLSLLFCGIVAAQEKTAAVAPPPTFVMWMQDWKSLPVVP